VPLRLLLDTHIFLWACEVPEKLSSGARHAIASTSNSGSVSSVTAWEIAIKCASGRMHFPLEQWADRIAELKIMTLPITPAYAIAAGQLPRHDNDPFDRMLIA